MSVVGRLSLLGAFIAGSAAAQPTSPFVTILDVVSGLNDVVGIVHPGGDDERLFIVEQSGKIRILQNGAVLSPPFIDLGQDGLDLSTFCLPANCGERGLLGLAFHPNYAVNGFFYVYYTRQGVGATVGDIVIARYTVSANPNLANTGSGSTVLVIEHTSQGNHNGGGMAFGPNDGYLYLSVGDGGSGGDPPENSQNIDVLLGKVLRLDIDGVDAFPADPDRNYALPAANPFVGGPGADEVWTVGLRNPFRFGFDREDGRLFIGDVGQGLWEEVDLQENLDGGVNFGWDCKEGAHLVDPEPDTGDEEDCDELASMVDPILEYPNPTVPDNPAAVTGGYVYRGGSSASIYGDYIFADFYSGLISRGVQNGANWTREDLIDTDYLISTFGQDKDGKLYFAHYFGSIYRIAPYSFSDVKPNDIDWAAIEALYLAGVTQGCEGGRYCPDGGIQRQQAAALLIRARDIGEAPPPACALPPFADVPADSPYCPWIAKLIEPAQKISNGCNAAGTLFCPTGPLTRAVLARFLLRTLDSPDPTTLSSCGGVAPFTDVPATHPLCDWIKTAVANGVLEACVSNTHFCPDDPVRRDQLAAILLKAAFSIEPRTP